MVEDYGGVLAHLVKQLEGQCYSDAQAVHWSLCGVQCAASFSLFF